MPRPNHISKISEPQGEGRGGAPQREVELGIQVPLWVCIAAEYVGLYPKKIRTWISRRRICEIERKSTSGYDKSVVQRGGNASYRQSQIQCSGRARESAKGRRTYEEDISQDWQWREVFRFYRIEKLIATSEAGEIRAIWVRKSRGFNKTREKRSCKRAATELKWEGEHIEGGGVWASTVWVQVKLFWFLPFQPISILAERRE